MNENNNDSLLTYGNLKLNIKSIIYEINKSKSRIFA